MAKDPSSVAAKWKRNLDNAGQSIQDGVNAVSTAPGQKAAAAQAKMVQRWNASVTSGKWAQKTAAVPLETWKSRMIEKGIPRMQAGTQLGQDKVTMFMQKALPYIASGQAKIAGMANVTPADNKARMNQWFDIMSAFKP